MTYRLICTPEIKHEHALHNIDKENGLVCKYEAREGEALRYLQR